MSDSTPVLVPADPADAARWQHTRVRRRMMDGPWGQDISEHLSKKLTPGRLVNLGPCNQSLNLFASTVRQLAVQYDSAPVDSNPELEDKAGAQWAELIDSVHLWSILQRNSETVIGLRESFVQVGWSAGQVEGDPGSLTVQPITPDVVVTECLPNNPDALTVFRMGVAYTIDGEQVPAWAVWDISDRTNPHFRVEAGDGSDLTAVVVTEPQPWPYYWEDGTPFLPFVKYRAAYTADQWDAYTLTELVYATLDVAILWTAWVKLMLDASWAQRWVIDLMLQGMSITGSGAGVTASVETDPTSILAFHSKPDKTGSAGQYQVPVDPLSMSESIARFQSTVLSNIGIHPADIEATQSPSSGVAITLKRSAQRRMALRLLPQFRSSDTRLLAMIARVSNIYGSTTYPTSGWELSYRLPEESVDEFLAELDRDERLVRLGFLSKVALMQKYRPELSRDEAIAALREVAADNAEFPLEGAPVLASTDTTADTDTDPEGPPPQSTGE